MRWMRNIALLLSVVLCLVEFDTERTTPMLQQGRNVESSAIELAQTVLHIYSDLNTGHVAEHTSPATVLTLRIPHTKGSSRHLSWLTMHPAAPKEVKPQFHGGHHSPKAVTTRQKATVLSRLCRLII